MKRISPISTRLTRAGLFIRIGAIGQYLRKDLTTCSRSARYIVRITSGHTLELFGLGWYRMRMSYGDTKALVTCPQ